MSNRQKAISNHHEDNVLTLFVLLEVVLIKKKDLNLFFVLVINLNIHSCFRMLISITNYFYRNDLFHTLNTKLNNQDSLRKYSKLPIFYNLHLYIYISRKLLCLSSQKTNFNFKFVKKKFFSNDSIKKRQYYSLAV